MFVFPNKPVKVFLLDNVFKIADSKEHWIVQPKWNGVRALPHCSEKGEIIVYSRYGTRLTKTKADWSWLAMLDFKRPWLLDGELLPDGQIIVWDIGVEGGKRIHLPYQKTLDRLMKGLPKVRKKGELMISPIKTLPMNKYREILLNRSDERLEGLVFKDVRATDLWSAKNTKNVSSQVKYTFD